MMQLRAFEPIGAGEECDQVTAVEAVESAIATFASVFARIVIAETTAAFRSMLEAERTPAPEPQQAGTVANMDVESAMQFLGISRDGLYKLIKSQAIQSFKIGSRRFFRPADLEAYRDSRVEENIRQRVVLPVLPAGGGNGGWPVRKRRAGGKRR
jgi:hypothetical protein